MKTKRNYLEELMFNRVTETYINDFETMGKTVKNLNLQKKRYINGMREVLERIDNEGTSLEFLTMLDAMVDEVRTLEEEKTMVINSMADIVRNHPTVMTMLKTERPELNPLFSMLLNYNN